MITFDDDYAAAGVSSSDEFSDWRRRNPRAFLLNCKRGEYMMHYAGCWHFDFKPNEPVSLTGNKKMCSVSREELENWIAAQAIQGILMCQHCFPG